MNFKKKIFLPNYLNFSNKKLFSTIRKARKDFNLSDPKKLSYTFMTSLSLILIFFMLPLAVKFKKDINLNKVEITNKSKTKFEKVLDGEVLDKSAKLDQGLDLKNLYEDVFKTDELPTDTVRLNASTIEELFKETDYNLEDVRETKLVKPIRLSLLPEEMRKIE